LIEEAEKEIIEKIIKERKGVCFKG